MTRSHKATLTSASLILLGLAASSPILAGTPIVPVSYSATTGEGVAQGGAFNYFDDTGKQLTDGVVGTDSWFADLGNGPAYEWVGWLTVDPTITFDFGQTVTIDSVDIGFSRSEGAGIYIPPDVTLGGTAFTLAPDALANDTRGVLTFNGSWTGSTLNLAMADNNSGHWIFVDEVKFTAAAVPEASTTVSLGLLLTLGLGGVVIANKRKRASA